jgi:hypothetical protein
MLPAINFTDAEHDEMQQRPPGDPQWRGFTEAQLAMRMSIGKKFAAFTLQYDDSMTEQDRRGYERAPLWGFYLPRGDDAWLPRRVYGQITVTGDDSQARAHVVSGHPMWINRVLGGVPLNELVRVDRWPERTLQMLREGLIPNAGWFEDPLGFFGVIESINR